MPTSASTSTSTHPLDRHPFVTRGLPGTSFEKSRSSFSDVVSNVNPIYNTRNICPSPQPARPMVIPMSNSARALRTGAPDPEKRGLSRSQQRHKGVPPAVAALLAITSIPPPKSKRERSRYDLLDEDRFATSVSTTEDLETTGDDLAYTDLFGDDGPFLEAPSSLSRSASSAGLSILTSSGEDLDDLCSEPLSRSQSSDSVPSLVNDSDSSLSWDGPATPSLKPDTLRRRAIERRARIVASPTEECHTDHPLLRPSPEIEAPEPSWIEERDVNTEKMPTAISKALSFKSNLTASLRVLKSAAKTFTSMSAQFVQPDDFLTRSIMSLTPQYRDERRPAFTKEENAPDPALRRYLNRTPPDRCTGAIQLQTYKKTVRRVRSSESKQRERSEARSPPPRQREVRENSDFLRVIVLEMNMRRVGKLSDTVGGRARLILPPRKIQKLTRPVGDATYWEALIF